MPPTVTTEEAALDVPNFLLRLGLDQHADARAIRRAYARLLKQVDQEHEADVFQDLRDAYEVALQWAAHQRWLQEQAHDTPSEVQAGADVRAEVQAEAEGQAEVQATPLPMPAGAPDGAAAVDPDLLSWDAYERFVAAAGLLTQGRMLRDQALWQAALTRELDDERLINVTARTIFEARIVHLLAGGWKLGHDTLFAAACAVFGWPGERRRLQPFGYAGGVLNRAIDERNLFEVQGEGELGMQQKVLARLTRAGAPEADQLGRDMFYLEQMLERFPTLMGLTADPDKVQQWRALHAQAQTARRGTSFDIDALPVPVLPKEKHHFRNGVVVVMLLFLFGLLHNIVNDHPDVPASERIVARQTLYRGEKLGQEPDFAPLLTTLEKKKPQAAAPARAAAPRAGLSRVQLDEIKSRIKYQRPASAAPATLRADFEVQLTLGGAVAAVVTTHASGDAAFDAAIAAAIRNSKPFPPATARRLNVTYQARYDPPVRRAALQPEVYPSLGTPALATDSLPLPGKKLAWPPGPAAASVPAPEAP